MLRVKVYILTGSKKSNTPLKKVLQGTYTYDPDTGLKLEIAADAEYPDTLRDMMKDPIWVPNEQGEMIGYHPATNPEGWIRNLHLEYKSFNSYFATEAVEVWREGKQ